MKKTKERIKLITLLFVFFLAGGILLGSESVNAMGSNQSVSVIGAYEVVIPEDGEQTEVHTKQTPEIQHISSSSGVTELDNAANKTNTLVTWVCSWIGGLMALFGIIWAAINQASHNSEGRNQGIIVGAIGIIVAFAPQITKMILGK